MSKRRGWALDLRVGLAVLFGLAALATALGTSILIAGFTAGAVLAATGRPHRLALQLVGLAEGFLVSLFFVTLGARLEFGALLGSGRALPLMAGLVVAATVTHVLVPSCPAERPGSTTAHTLSCRPTGSDMCAVPTRCVP